MNFTDALMQEDLEAIRKCPKADLHGLLSEIKPYGFTQFIKRFEEDELIDCLERKEKNGIIYHREGVSGDYDDFADAEELIEFIKTGTKKD